MFLYIGGVCLLTLRDKYSFFIHNFNLCGIDSYVYVLSLSGICTFPTRSFVLTFVKPSVNRSTLSLLFQLSVEGFSWQFVSETLQPLHKSMSSIVMNELSFHLWLGFPNGFTYDFPTTIYFPLSHHIRVLQTLPSDSLKLTRIKLKFWSNCVAIIT
jgi:hypothetical protein